MSRRQFFTLNLGATVDFFENLLVPQLELELERDFFRPPGTVNELHFLSSCTRCGLCKASCPENIIKMFSSAAGAKLMNTPYINPNDSPCTFCNKCIEACSADALSMNDLSRIGTARINENTCLAYENVLCDYCVYSCPVEGAIRLIKGKPVVNSEACNGCGVCVARCIAEDKGIYIYPAV